MSVQLYKPNNLMLMEGPPSRLWQDCMDEMLQGQPGGFVSGVCVFNEMYLELTLPMEILVFARFKIGFCAFYSRQARGH